MKRDIRHFHNQSQGKKGRMHKRTQSDIEKQDGHRRNDTPIEEIQD